VLLFLPLGHRPIGLHVESRELVGYYVQSCINALLH
jgi:hypothetical protein